MRRILLQALVVSLMTPVAFAGSITGKITYDGDVPRLRPYDAAGVPECASKHSGGKVPNQMLVLGDGNALANIFVQIKNPPSGDHQAPSQAVEIDQNGCIYLPRVVGVMRGQTLRFKNSDGILHNVHGLPSRNREFNIGMPPAVKEKDVTLNKPEPLFKVKCDVHPWMTAYVAVMTHPYFAVTGTDGRFEIGDLPDGTYEVEAWHEHLSTQTGTATVSGGAASVDFSFKPPSKR